MLDGWTDGRNDGQTDGWIKPLIEFLCATKNAINNVRRPVSIPKLLSCAVRLLYEENMVISFTCISPEMANDK